MNNKRVCTAVLAAILTLSLMGTACGKQEVRPPAQDQVTSDWENTLASKRPESDFIPDIPEDSTAQLQVIETVNNDIVGWLHIPGTEIKEAVVQAADNAYYYRRDVNKQYAFSGSLWLDFEDVIGDGKPENFSQNMIIYGHNLGNPQGMKDDPDGVKFAQLFKFDEIAFAKEHPYFYFTTDAGTHVYEIFTVFYSENILTPVPYHYATYSPSDYQKLLSDVRNRSQYDYNVTVGLEDKIMTLSTCSYKYGTYTQNPNQRFVVMGKWVDVDADLYEIADLQQNPDAKAPLFK